MWNTYRPIVVTGITGLLMLLIPEAGMAQQQINTQVNNPNPPQNPNNPATLRYTPQIGLMPSEQLFAYQRSGMTPSELRMNLAAIGPQAPQGAIDYISPQSQLQRDLRLPPPLLYNPAYVRPEPANINAPEPPPALPPTENLTLNRFPAAPSRFSIGPGPIDDSVSGVIPAPTNQESTVTYHIPMRSRSSPDATFSAPAPQRPPRSGPASKPPASQPARTSAHQ